MGVLSIDFGLVGAGGAISLQEPSVQELARCVYALWELTNLAIRDPIAAAASEVYRQNVRTSRF